MTKGLMGVNQSINWRGLPTCADGYAKLSASLSAVNFTRLLGLAPKKLCHDQSG
jgi:hypothetical protein